MDNFYKTILEEVQADPEIEDAVKMSSLAYEAGYATAIRDLLLAGSEDDGLTVTKINNLMVGCKYRNELVKKGKWQELSTANGVSFANSTHV